MIGGHLRLLFTPSDLTSLSPLGDPRLLRPRLARLPPQLLAARGHVTDGSDGVIDEVGGGRDVTLGALALVWLVRLGERLTNRTAPRVAVRGWRVEGGWRWREGGGGGRAEVKGGWR